MADEGNGLRDPWAPPEHPPAGPPPEPESNVPTRAVPIEPVDAPPTTIEPPMAPAPEPERDRRRWPAAAKAIVAALVVLLIATAAALGYGWWKTNEDKKDLETVSNQQGQELTQQRDKSNQDLATAQHDLDAANKHVADLQSQLSTAQSDATAAKQQADALQALFPINASSVAAGLPGTYRSDPVSAPAGGCSLASCPSVQLTLSIERTGGAATISDPALGRVPLQTSAAGWTATGPATASLQLQCAGAPVATSFTLWLSPAAVALDSKGAAQVTTLAGNLLLSSAAVTEPPGGGCPPGVASYPFAANRS